MSEKQLQEKETVCQHQHLPNPFMTALKQWIILITFSILISIAINNLGSEPLKPTNNAEISFSTGITKAASPNMYLISEADLIKLANMVKENVALRKEIDVLKEVLERERKMFEDYRKVINEQQQESNFPIVDFNMILLLGTSFLGGYFIRGG